MALQLKRQGFKEISMKANIRENGKMEIGSKFNFSINFASAGKICTATLRQTVEKKNEPEVFCITVEAVGVFSCDECTAPEDKRRTHVEAYRWLFPYVQRKVAQLFVDAGLPPLFIEMMPMREEDVLIVGPMQGN